MVTFKQLIKNIRKKKIHKCRTTALKGNPQKRGICVKLMIVKPKKPNSANRKIAKIRLCTGRQVDVAIPGFGHSINKFSNVLIRGGRIRDVPGVRYKAIKNKYDFVWTEAFNRVKSRSKFGKPKSV